MSQMIRAFIAIDMPDPVRDGIARLQASLPVGKPVPAETLHLTLAFLGEQPEERLEEAHHRLEGLSVPGFDLRLAGLDTFGGREPRGLVVSVPKNAELDHLHKRVKAALHGAGVTLNRQRFRPHVTLARFRPGMSLYEEERLRRFLSDNADFRPKPFPVTGFALYGSTLRPEGAVHDEMAWYPLT